MYPNVPSASSLCKAAGPEPVLPAPAAPPAALGSCPRLPGEVAGAALREGPRRARGTRAGTRAGSRGGLARGRGPLGAFHVGSSSGGAGPWAASRRRRYRERTGEGTRAVAAARGRPLPRARFLSKRPEAVRGLAAPGGRTGRGPEAQVAPRLPRRPRTRRPGTGSGPRTVACGGSSSPRGSAARAGPLARPPPPARGRDSAQGNGRPESLTGLCACSSQVRAGFSHQLHHQEQGPEETAAEPRRLQVRKGEGGCPVSLAVQVVCLPWRLNCSIQRQYDLQ